MRWIAAYAVIALLTFGYSASSTDSCRERPWEGPIQVSECRFMVGISSGIAWPLYWVWAGFDATRPGGRT